MGVDARAVYARRMVETLPPALENPSRERRDDAFVEAGARGRLAWVGSFFGLAISYLALRGEAPWLVLTQAFFVIASVIASWRSTRRGSSGVDAFALWAALACACVVIGTTGGLASPLVLAIVPLHATIDAASGARKLGIVGHVVVAILLGVMAVVPAMSWASPIPEPLQHAEAGRPSLDYALLAFVTVVFVVTKQFLVARGVHRAFAAVAGELTARRHELFEEAESRTRSMEAIAARLAHEVKNPLAAIKGLSRHLEKSAADAKTAERLAIVAQEADRLASIVDGFLSFSRGLDDLHMAPLRPYDLARELMFLLETRASELGVTMEVTGAVDVTMRGDGRKLRQALLNLCLNALQATPAGGAVTIEVVADGEGDVLFRVIDRGAGMASEVLERIKKPYFTTRDGGSGLGVAVARGIVEQHGGSLTYESKVGTGTIATMRMPLRADVPQSLLLPRPSSLPRGPR
jgi:signal transduction histidine kinase